MSLSGLSPVRMCPGQRRAGFVGVVGEQASWSVPAVTSEWKITPGSGRRVANAWVSAAVTRSVRMC